MTRNLYYKVSLVVWMIGMILYFFTDKEQVTLFANRNNTPFLDIFFKWYTRIAEWIIIAIPLLLGLLMKGFRFFIAAGIMFLLEALIVNGCKLWIFTHEARPSVEFSNQIHSIDGVTLLQWNSFPSGHTAAAIIGFGILSWLTNKQWLQVVFVLAAFLVGYSRMYLGQHFLRDVCAGAAISLLLLWLFPSIKQLINSIGSVSKQ